LFRAEIAANLPPAIRQQTNKRICILHCYQSWLNYKQHSSLYYKLIGPAGL